MVQVLMIVLLLDPMDSQPHQITHLLLQQKEIILVIKLRLVPVEMLRSLLEVVGLMDPRQDDSIRMSEPIRLRLHGIKFSLFQQIIQNTSMSILASTLSSNPRHEQGM